jgi:hypothetical protein
MKAIVAALAAAGFLAATGSAFAEEIQCAKRDLLIGLLAKKYSETPVGTGTINDDRYMQLFVSAQGSWTVIVTKTDGQSCIVAAGRNWEALPQLAKAEPAA